MAIRVVVDFKTEKYLDVTIIMTIVTKMIPLLKTGYWKIMYIFYKDKAARLHLRELARRTKLHEPSVTKVLADLEKENILKSEKEGNLKKYSTKQNNKTYLLYACFDIDQFNDLPSIRQNAIKYYLDSLPEKPIIAFLFGSSAKGAYTKKSDIDILLITNKKIDVSKAETHAEALTALRISTFQLRIDDFVKELKLKQDHVIQSAINTGYPLTNHIYYYGLVYNGH